MWFTKSCFSAPIPLATVLANHLDPLLAAGNAGRNVLRGPGVKNWDIGIFKMFSITERHRIQFRAELFNAFNLVNFGNPTTDFSAATFGRIVSAATSRQIQLGLKYNF